MNLGRAWGVDLIIVFNASEYVSALNSIKEVTKIWKENLEKVCVT